MGLAGRKIKQRIGADPRNLTWIDDSSKFGEKYLQSLGWTSGQGLGLTGDGRKDNIKIHQKLDLLGIGANRRGPEADDWRAGQEYDRLLSRLNQTQDTPQEPQESISLSGFHKASVSEPSLDEPGQMNKKKRKRSSNEETEEKPIKESRKKDKKDKKDKKKKNKETNEDKEVAISDSTLVTPNVDVPQTGEKDSTTKGPVYRAHRKRHLAAKRLAATSSQSMKEILGISTTGETDTTPPYTAEPVPVFAVDATIKEEMTSPKLETNLLRKSEKSMADYFSEKLRLKKQKP